MLNTLTISILALALLTSNLSAGEPTDGYLSTIERSVLDELNLARSSPKKFAEYLTKLRQYYHGKELRRPGEVILVTHEGLSALDEAIGYLASVKPVSILTPSEGLSRSASDHARDQASSGAMGHVGSNGSQPWDRMNRYGTWQKAVAENIMYGSNSARDVVIQLIVDDGIPGRGHRLNIFNPEYRLVGIACGPHARFGLMCVMDFAAEYSGGTILENRRRGFGLSPELPSLAMRRTSFW